MQRLCFLLLVSWCSACSPEDPLPPASPTDGERADGGALPDGRSPADGGTSTEAGLPDMGSLPDVSLAPSRDGTAPTPALDAAVALDSGPQPPSDAGDEPSLDEGPPTPMDRGIDSPLDAELDPDAEDPVPRPDRGVPMGNCPEAWLTGALEADGQGMWSVTGNTNDHPNRTQGNCGGGSAQDVYEFTAPEAGQYAVEVVGEGIGSLGFAVVYVRVQCDAPATELACDARREPRAISIVDLDAQQTVYLLVDGIHTGAFPSTGGYRLRVYPQRPPVLGAAAAWMNDENGSTVLEVRGTVGNVALEGIQYRFLDGEEGVVPSRGQQEPLRFGVQFNVMEREGGSPTFEGVLAFNAEVPRDLRPDVAQVELAVYDTLGALSAVQTIDVAEPDPLEIGDACDVAGARDRCPDGTECFIRDPVFDPGPACHPSGQNCPAGWTSIDLSDFQQGNDSWHYEGNLLRQDPPLERHNVGSCPGATGFNDLFTFTAPVAGRYRVRTSGMMGDTILWVRSDCGVDGAAAELGCNDDGPGAGRFSILDLGLDARQTVYVFVDSFGQGNRNAYALTVSRD